MNKAKSQTNYIFAGVEMRCILTASETNNTFCLFENTSHGNSGTPVHVHSREDETLFVIEGEMSAAVAGVSRRVLAGEAMFLPRGVPHQLKNESGSPSRYVILCVPGGFEDFVAFAGHIKAPGEKPAAPTSAEIRNMLEAASQFGIEILPSF